MKHTELHSVAHNFADSLAGGISFIVGCYDLDVFAVAAANTDNSVLIDFLNGKIESECDDEKLEAAIPLFKNAFPGFCDKHGISSHDFKRFVARYVASASGPTYTITIEDRRGRKSAKEYFGIPGRKREALDHLGRRRPKPDPQPTD